MNLLALKKPTEQPEEVQSPFRSNRYIRRTELLRTRTFWIDEPSTAYAIAREIALEGHDLREVVNYIRGYDFNLPGVNLKAVEEQADAIFKRMKNEGELCNDCEAVLDGNVCSIDGETCMTCKEDRAEDKYWGRK